MAHVEVGNDKLAITLSLGDEILSLHGAFHLPYSHITSVSTDPVPEAWFRGIRIGTNLPGVKTAGTFIAGDGTIFYDFHNPDRCLTFDLNHERVSPGGRGSRRGTGSERPRSLHPPAPVTRLMRPSVVP